MCAAVAADAWKLSPRLGGPRRDPSASLERSGPPGRRPPLPVVEGWQDERSRTSRDADT